MKRLFYYLGIITAIAIVLTACGDDDNGSTPTPKSIVEIAQETPELSSLVSALIKYPDLVNTLSAPGTFTVFAPDNDAFAALLTAIGQTSINDVPEDVLRNVLEYHVHTSAAIASGDVAPGTLVMVNGEEATLTTTGGVFVDGAEVSTADVEASNGIVHIIDAVIVPSEPLAVLGTIVAPAYFNSNFTTLIAAVRAADTDILGLLLGNGPSDSGLTLFAPTNDAFDAAGITDVNSADAVLAYHLLDGVVNAGGLPATSGSAAEIETLGGNFYLTNAGSGVFINGTTEVTNTDIAGSNGVVHVIDRTLLPPTQTINEIVGAFAGGDPAEFTLLATALSRAGLETFFSGNGLFTVFAPTDQAFLDAGLDAATINATEPSAVAGILTHHVVKPNVNVFSSDLADGAVTMLNDQNVAINVTELTIQDAAGSDPAAKLVASVLNVHATNGVIHVIDKVLLPE